MAIGKTNSAGKDTSDATATANDILSGKTAYVDGEKITGNIVSKSSSDLTKSGATVTAPAGYYASNASASISSGSATTPATTITVTPSISVSSAGVITASNSGTKSVTPTVSAGYVSSGTAGTITVDGSNTSNLTTLAATTYNTSTSDQTIASGKYITGTQTIKAVTTSNIDAGNIKYNVTVKVGDANSATRIKNVTGTFTSTVSSGQTKAAAAQIRSGYSAYIDGAEVKGSIGNLTLPTAAASSATSGYTSKATIGRSTSAQYINIPPGYLATGGYYTISAVANGSATTPATTISVTPSISVSSAGVITASNSGTKSVTPTVSAGYISSGTAGTITVSGSNTKNLTTKAATTFNVSTSNQTIASGTYLTGTQTFRGVTTSNISAGNIKSGVTIQVGDAGSAGRIANVTGTYTGTFTIVNWHCTSGSVIKAANLLNPVGYAISDLTVFNRIVVIPSTDSISSYSSVTDTIGYRYVILGSTTYSQYYTLENGGVGVARASWNNIRNNTAPTFATTQITLPITLDYTPSSNSNYANFMIILWKE